MFVFDNVGGAESRVYLFVAEAIEKCCKEALKWREKCCGDGPEGEVWNSWLQIQNHDIIYQWYHDDNLWSWYYLPIISW